MFWFKRMRSCECMCNIRYCFSWIYFSSSGKKLPTKFRLVSDDLPEGFFSWRNKTWKKMQKTSKINHQIFYFMLLSMSIYCANISLFACVLWWFLSNNLDNKSSMQASNSKSPYITIHHAHIKHKNSFRCLWCHQKFHA